MSGILLGIVGATFSTPPLNTVAPAVTGTAVSGSTLSCTDGTWTGTAPITYTYQWQRTTTNIGGATSSTYVIVSGDVGSTIRCVVTATNIISAVSANSNSTGVVVAGRALYMWGQNNYGQLGLGDATNRSSPVQVGALTNWSDSKTRGTHAIAVKTDGTLWTWGSNGSGQLGLGNTTTYSSPKQVGALTGWASIENQSSAVASIKTDGTLWSWGINTVGCLGHGNTTNYSSPKQVGALTNWSRISMTASRVTASIKTDGTLWTWGEGYQGGLGLGNTTDYSSPKQVGALTSWDIVSTGTYSTFAIKTDGTLWSWGFGGSFGALGLGNTTNYSSPKQVGALTTWAKVSGGNLSCRAIKTDGTLWSWGRGIYGQLGHGNTTNYSSPKQVGALTNWASISTRGSSGYTTLGIKTDGTIWGFGRNHVGQLGLGNTTTYSSPKQVGALTGWQTSSTGGYTSTAIILV